jgi:hypothetical protein
MPVPPSPILAPFAFIGAFPFEFPMPLPPIPMPRSCFAFVPLVVIAIFGIIVASLAALFTPSVIVVVILCAHCERQYGATTQSADEFPST